MPMKIEYARIGLYPGGGGGVSDDDLKENWSWGVNWIHTSSALLWDFT